MRDTIGTALLAVADPSTAGFLEVNLRLEGFDVLRATDGVTALRTAVAGRPDLALVGSDLPGIDGLEVCRRLRRDPRTSHLPVIILSPRGAGAEEAARGLACGADDHVRAPFEPVELLARVRRTLRRTADLRGASPLTGLPGNHLIARELAVRMASGEPLALVYADLNDFKSFNDRYGFLRGDEVIVLAADVLRATALRVADDAFIGHVGGDDFMVLCRPEDVAPYCEGVLRAFDEGIVAHYDAVDLVRGHLVLADRQGEVRRHPIVSIALGVATTERRCFEDHREVVAVATEMKTFLKQRGGGSAYAVDGRMELATAGAHGPVSRLAAHGG